MLIKLINQSIVEPETNKIEMIMNSDSTATLKFYKILDFKVLEQLSLNMKLGDAEVINDHVAFQYKLVKKKMNDMKSKLEEIVQIIKDKNPSLIYQINRAATATDPKYSMNIKEQMRETRSRKNDQ